ncbi:MAG: hypothetical protein M1840_008104 [Geoglossum simile]|nr:MAG: hypothetical protein M1840_008104 [Geoglossum simile]
MGVYEILQEPPEFVKKQIYACVDDTGDDVVKVGMLASAETIRVVANALRIRDLLVSVISPVRSFIRTSSNLSNSGAGHGLKSGAQLLPKDAVKRLLFAPNIPEAKLLLQDAGQTVTDPKCLGDIVDIARRVYNPRYVLVKGGHLRLDKYRPGFSAERGELVVVNALYRDNETFLIERYYTNVKNTHSTTTAAITCNLAQGQDVVQCSGSYSTSTVVKRVWEDFTQHDLWAQPIFPLQLTDSRDTICSSQRAASYKARTMSDISRSTTIVNHTVRKMALRISYCEEFELSERDILSHQESQGRNHGSFEECG